MPIPTDFIDNFEDQESKEIYIQRNYYNQTKDINFIKKMCFDTFKRRTGIEWEVWLARLDSSKKIVAFGSGAIGLELQKILTGTPLSIDYFCDNNQSKWGERCRNIPIISPMELKEFIGQVYIIIATSIPTYISEVKSQLLKLGFDKKDIIFSCEDLGRQYFDFDKLNFTKDEIFVDAGCFNADDSIEFIQQCKDGYKGIYAFEPDRKNFIVSKKRLEQYLNVEMIDCGLWDKSGEITFLEEMTGSSHIDTNATNSINVNSLDNILNGRPVTYIKMDIEGAELLALKGAKKTICDFKPRLAICVYHKPKDIYEIPLYLKKIAPEYKLYLRHYSLGLYETVLYAVP